MKTTEIVLRTHIIFQQLPSYLQEAVELAELEEAEGEGGPNDGDDLGWD